MDKNKKNMSQLRQSLYTFLLITTCLIASPLMYSKIWKSSAEKGKPQNIPAASANTVTTAPKVQETTSAEKQEVETDSDFGSGSGVDMEDFTYPHEKEQEQEQQTEPQTEEVKEPEFKESGLEYFDDALFVGDSRMVGMRDYGTIPNASYFCDIGLSTVQLNEGYYINGVTFDDMLSYNTYGKVYIMLGINEMGNYFENTIEQYKMIVDKVKAYQPDAIIYLMANLHVSTWAQTEIITNTGIDYLNSRMAELADNKTVFYIDINEIFDDEYGALRADYSGDGIHIMGMYFAQWCDWVCKHTIVPES